MVGLALISRVAVQWKCENKDLALHVSAHTSFHKHLGCWPSTSQRHMTSQGKTFCLCVTKVSRGCGKEGVTVTFTIECRGVLRGVWLARSFLLLFF